MKYSIACLLLLLSSCGNYSLSLNEKLMYTPPGIFTDFRLADTALQRCIDQKIKEEKLTRASQLLSLQCPGKNVQSLKNIEVFAAIEVLGLEHNEIEDLGAIGKLENLQQLNLKANRLTSIKALHKLTKLHYLDLRGNSSLKCEELKGFKLAEITKIIAPKHCNSGA